MLCNQPKLMFHCPWGRRRLPGYRCAVLLRSYFEIDVRGVDIVVSTSKSRQNRRTTTARNPHYSLADVNRLGKLARIGGNVARRTANELAESLLFTETYIRKLLSGLKSSEFVEPVVLDYDERDVQADVYGVRNDDGDWYVKFHIQHGQIVVTSCHEPERPLTRVDGLTIGGPKP